MIDHHIIDRRLIIIIISRVRVVIRSRTTGYHCCTFNQPAPFQAAKRLAWMEQYVLRSRTRILSCMRKQEDDSRRGCHAACSCAPSSVCPRLPPPAVVDHHLGAPHTHDMHTYTYTHTHIRTHTYIHTHGGSDGSVANQLCPERSGAPRSVCRPPQTTHTTLHHTTQHRTAPHRTDTASPACHPTYLACLT